MLRAARFWTDPQVEGKGGCECINASQKAKCEKEVLALAWLGLCESVLVDKQAGAAPLAAFCHWKDSGGGRNGNRLLGASWSEEIRRK